MANRIPNLPPAGKPIVFKTDHLCNVRLRKLMDLFTEVMPDEGPITVSWLIKFCIAWTAECGPTLEKMGQLRREVD